MHENKMGVMPVGRLIINMSWPAIVSMLVQAMYNIVDSFFVSRISEAALAAITYIFPVQMVLIAVAVGHALRPRDNPRWAGKSKYPSRGKINKGECCKCKSTGHWA